MLDIEDDVSRREKCYTTIGRLPSFIDPKQPPTTKSPFSAVWGHPFVHTVEVILPEEVYSTIEDSIAAKFKKLQYARVFMSLSSILEREFFNTYVKSGNVLMISEGRPGSDNVFTLRDGILKLELGKEIFERTGFTGKPIRSGGRKHAKERYLVEINLRLPSMLHGKKGFERIEWAFKNVLNQSVAWLFYDLSPESSGVAEGDKSLKGNHPQIIDCEVIPTHRPNILVPSFSEMNITEQSLEEDLKESCDELSEWLGMVTLKSPRVLQNDDTDPYLCRYSVPGIEEPEPQNLVSLKWHGLIPPRWIVQLIITLLKGTNSSTSAVDTWFALNATALGRDAVEGKDGYTVMALPLSGSAAKVDDDSEKAETAHTQGGRSFVCWEFVGASIL
ncbi:hypothetical protein FE257_000321 [Aspergillus nanangensis]|uniref:Uncharacterized protein n=1 Tax=Aspergillus nanangensis TaxID=2582783 RepID=A0AAD4CZ57_ASPNN|nr:hypothetical protein FE257_000321 [Aspergillus nanangensis]